MAHITGVFRIGQDVELRILPDGMAVANLSLASNYGKKNADGKRPTQWIKATLWGDRAERLEPYLLKGTSVYCILSDFHIETFQKGGGGEGFGLVGRVDSIDFVSTPKSQDAPRQEAPRQEQRPPPRQEAPRQEAPRQRATTPAQDFNDMDDSDIPF